MTPERARDVERICEAALERAVAARAAFLAEACGGDEELRRQVELLLAQESAAASFLETPALVIAAQHVGIGVKALAIGQQIGPYTILSPLGAGGMGEVYRARDATLRRDVAIKVLPTIFTSDPERLARFEREARLLAALNHPHIGAIYGVEESGGTRALVLELVEGDTIAERLAKGPIPVREALHIAQQIADALDAAHERGIIHRDLKPANIKITSENVVKVLDFGLAKAASGEASSPNLAESATFTNGGGSRDGVILGTVAYMSPEQARGKRVDKRTDIWAFGCVLYEMLTGHAPFARETITDTLSAVVERDPSWPTLPATTPAAVQRLLIRCLDKDRRRRLHDIADARIEIEDILTGASLASTETAVVPPQQRLGRFAWSIGVIAWLVVLIGVGAWAWSVRTPPRTPRVSRTTIPSSGAAALAVTGLRSMAITPDGTRVIYVGNNGTQLFVRSLDRLEPTAISTGAARLNWVFVSPDGQWVGFVEGNTLKKVSLTGGPVVTIAELGASSRGATWAQDDTIVFATSDQATGLRRVSAAGGVVTVLTRPAPARGEVDHLWPEMLPDGRGVLFTITASSGGLDTAQVAVLDLATGKSDALIPGGSHAHYVASGHLVYTVAGTLRAIPFDLDGLKTHGTPVTLLPQPATTPQGSADFVVAADGTLAYVDAPGAAAAAARTLVWVDRQGREDLLPAPARAYFQPRVSPDGTHVAVAINEQATDIWVWDLARQVFSQLTFDPATDISPVWTDQHRLVFFSNREGGGVFQQLANGAGAAERLGVDGQPSGVTPDGTQVLFSRSELSDFNIMAVTLDGTRRVRTLLQTPAVERNGVVSPDGRWLAYESDSAGRFEIYVRPFPDVNLGQRLVSTDGGTRPLWAPPTAKDPELFYVARDGALMAVRVDPHGDVWSVGIPSKVVEGPYATAGSRFPRTYDVSADGRRFLMVKQPTNQAAPQIVVVQNWIEELNRLVPTP